LTPEDVELGVSTDSPNPLLARSPRLIVGMGTLKDIVEGLLYRVLGILVVQAMVPGISIEPSRVSRKESGGSTHIPLPHPR
jgi:hypothetical protein